MMAPAMARSAYGQRVVRAELDFPAIAPRSYVVREVPFEGAKVHNEVTIIEPWARPAGVRFRGTVARDGLVLVYCENKTGDTTITVPAAVYGVTVDV